jgi:hypothetical protein
MNPFGGIINFLVTSAYYYVPIIPRYYLLHLQPAFLTIYDTDLRKFHLGFFLTGTVSREELIFLTCMDIDSPIRRSKEEPLLWSRFQS